MNRFLDSNVKIPIKFLSNSSIPLHHFVIVDVEINLVRVWSVMRKHLNFHMVATFTKIYPAMPDVYTQGIKKGSTMSPRERTRPSNDQVRMVLLMIGINSLIETRLWAMVSRSRSVTV